MGQDSEGRSCIIFAKWPAVGKVKTRLAAGSSNELATQFYRLCCSHIVAECSRYSLLPTSREHRLADHAS